MDQEEKDWILKRVDEALDAHPVADDVVSTIKERLAGTMCKRALRPGELTDLAKNLVDNVTAPLGEEANK